MFCLNGYGNIETFPHFAYPTTVIEESGTMFFFQRQLYQRMISSLEWEIPLEWDEKFFKYVLYGRGFLTIFNDKNYGTIPMNCTLSGFGLWYQPTKVLIANPLLNYNELTIGKDCELLTLTPDYMGVFDIIEYYAYKLAQVSSSIDMSLTNSKIAFVMVAKSKNQADTLKSIYDRVQSGEPLIVTDKKGMSYNDDGTLTEPWHTFTTNVKESFITLDLLESWNKIVSMFDREIGIPTANTDKKERMIVDEVNANNAESISRITVWLESLNECIEKINKKYNLNLSVKLREYERGGKNEENNINRLV